MMLLGYIILGLLVLIIILIFVFRPQQADVVDLTMKMDKVASVVLRLEQTLKEDFKTNREELSKIAKDNREELNSTLLAFKTEFAQTLAMMSNQNTQSLQNINQTLDEKVNALMVKVDQNNQANRSNLAESLKDFVLEQRQKFDDLKAEQRDMTQKTAILLDKITAKVEEKLAFIIESEKKDNILIREAMDNAFKGFQVSFDKNVDSFNQLQREKFALLEERQNKLVDGTEKKLEQIRVTVDEKLQKTLNERLGQSFELVGKQLESVQKGLGEMQVLAQDVGGLKKVLSNVKLRGGIGEVQLEMLLEQILAPEQYAKNVKTKTGSNDSVEFAIKLPGRDDHKTPVWLPIDAKFPKDVYQQLQTAYDGSDTLQIELAQRMLDMAIKKMAKDIHDKYIDPPNTTDFGIMFLPFEGIYGEVVRKASLLDDLQRTYRIVVTGPTTLAAILNSLQMGFKTMAIQQRTSEVWKILGAVKKEFELFGGLLDKAQNNIQLGLNQLDDVVGKRTRAIQRKLKSVESLSAADTILILEETAERDLLDDEES